MKRLLLVVSFFMYGLEMGCQTAVPTALKPCGETFVDGKAVAIGLNLAAMRFDASLTWTNYRGIGDPDLAVYVWNGQDIGQGAPGFQTVLQHLKALKDGASVLIYPMYPYPTEAPSGPNRMYTFDPYDQRGAFSQLVTQKHLSVIFSPFDPSGRLLYPP